MNILDKFGDFKNHGKIAAVNNDWFSDLRNNTLDSLGVTKDIRDAAQPVIDYGKNQVLPQGGAVQPYDPGNSSEWIATGYKYVSNASPLMIAGGVLLVVAAVYYIGKGK